jgi:DNA-binding MarR family transcriptional regulator
VNEPADDATPWLDANEDRAWRSYRRLVTLLEARLARDLEIDSNLSMPDYEVLSTISEAPDGHWRLSALAHRMRWSQSRLSHHVTRMERRNLVARRPAPDDRRGVDILLTEHGRTVLEGAAPDHVVSVRRHLFDRLDEEQILRLAEIAEAVATPLESGTDE